MSKNIKIVELLRRRPKGFQSSQLILELSGKLITTPVVNTLKRTIEDNVPTYAFLKDNILIEKNTSVFDNDYMRMRLEQFTIPDLKVPVAYLPDEYWMRVDYSDPERNKHPEDSRLIEFAVNAVNNTDNILNITTASNDFKLFEDGVEDTKKFKNINPQLLIKLKPGQEFKCTAKASLGCGRRKDIWSAVANAYFETDDEKTFKFTVESQGQLDEYKILYTGCEVIKSKLQNIKERIEANSKLININEKDTQLHIKLDNETHTMGIIINDALQDNPDIIYSGVSKPDVFKDEIFIKIESKNKNPLKYFFKSLDDLSELYDDIQKNFKK